MGNNFSAIIKEHEITSVNTTKQ